MRIERVEVVPLALPFAERYVTASGTLDRRELALLYLHTDAGPVGLGEAAPMVLRGGRGLGDTTTELCTVCGPVLEGTDASDLAAPERPAAAAPGVRRLVELCRERGCSAQSLAAVDMALHDLAGKLSGQPVWRILGAARAAPVSCNATIPGGEPSRMEARTAGWVEHGFRTFKVKVEPGREREQVAAVRGVVGTPAKVRVDVNGAWTVEEGVRKIGELERFELELVEEPAAALPEMSAVKRLTTVPIAADESVATVADAREAVRLRSCDMATVKVAHSGGIIGTLAIAAELPVYLSSAIDGPLGIAAAAHAVQALPAEGTATGLAHGLATEELLAGRIAASGWQLRGDALHPPDGPGLGVELDHAAVARYRV